MNRKNSWQVSNDAAEVYEQVWVSAMLGQWVTQVADAAQIGEGDHVLDVGCGTGIVAREAISRVGPTGQVIGLDLNAEMLAVAKKLNSKIRWHQGDALDMPFEDETFDVVVCQFVLMYLPNRVAAIKEMLRVLKPNGRLALAVWTAFERAKGYVILTDIAQRQCGEEAVNMLTAPFALGNESKLTELFNEVGPQNFRIELREGTIQFSSIDFFIASEVKGTPLDDLLTDDSYQALLDEARIALKQFETEAGEVVMPMDAYIISMQK